MKPNKFTFFMFLGVICSVLVLSACERSASTAPVPSNTPSALTPSPTFRPLAITLAAPGTPLPEKAVPDIAGTANPVGATPGSTEATPAATAQPVDKNSPYMGKHTVRNGETLYMIGRAYGVSPMAIADANKLAEPYTIFPGNTLNIPRVRWPGGVPQGPTAQKQFEPNF
jgi:LysM repeat protein